MTEQPLLIGIDGGGSKTLALLTDSSGQVLGRSAAPSSNYFTTGKEAAFAALEEAVSGCFATAGMVAQPVTAVCMGLSGVDRPADRAIFLPWATRYFVGAKLAIVNDAELLLAAGTPDGWGIAVICGTGSIVIGKNQTGETLRADGWGYLLGDLGSGYWIGLLALQAVMAAYDQRGPATSLTETLLAACDLKQPTEFLPWIYRERVPTVEIAALSQWVDTAAGNGDRVAQSILDEASRQLARSVQTVSKRLQVSGTIPCALGGGVITRGTQMCQRFTDTTQEMGLQLAPITPVTEPVYGAIRLAQRLLLGL